MRITTTEHTHPTTGARRIVATGSGKQRTVPYAHNLTQGANHGEACGTLALALIEGKTARKVAAKTSKVIQHLHNGKMRFSLGE